MIAMAETLTTPSLLLSFSHMNHSMPITQSTTMASQIENRDSSSDGSWSVEDSGGVAIENSQRNHHRHSPHQIQRLEAFYKEWQHPNINQQQQLGTELGLTPEQVKYWFQNKRSNSKNNKKRDQSSHLRSENEWLRGENRAMKETLKNAICMSCEGLSSTDIKRKADMYKLEQENEKLRIELERMCSILAEYMGKPVSGPTINLQDSSLLYGQGNCTSSSRVDSVIGSLNNGNINMADQMKANAEVKKSLMAEIAGSAVDELIKLFKTDEPLWIKSSKHGQYFLDRCYYQKTVSLLLRLRYPKSRVESSKDSGVVLMSAESLVEVYLNPVLYATIFPSVISKARTINVLKAGSLNNQSGALQLIYEKRNILTPLVQPREFYVLRYCHQIDTGIWVIADVSYDFLNGGSHDISTGCWKYPSGFMIQAMPNGLSKVTCIEHVEVDQSIQVHPLYEDLVKSALGFGARRWITTLQRTLERYSFLIDSSGKFYEHGGTRNVLVLADKVVNSYCSIFGLLRSSHSCDLTQLTNDGIKIAVRKNSSSDLPIGIIVTATTSFRVPAPTQAVVKYLNDPILRSEWDVLCNGSPVRELMRIQTGSQSANCISVLQPVNTSENLVILQESMVDQLGSYIAYAPVEATTMNEVANGNDWKTVPILASGFTVMSDGADPTAVPSSSSSVPVPGGGSLVTVAYQIMASTLLTANDVNTTNVAKMASDLVARTVHVIESALSSS